ncbi:hypothetical protein YB2330_000442 [Saitoella coloradoensis]
MAAAVRERDDLTKEAQSKPETKVESPDKVPQSKGETKVEGLVQKLPVNPLEVLEKTRAMLKSRTIRAKSNTPSSLPNRTPRDQLKATLAKTRAKRKGRTFTFKEPRSEVKADFEGFAHELEFLEAARANLEHRTITAETTLEKQHAESTTHTDLQRVNDRDIKLESVAPLKLQEPVPSLAHGLDRVLFNPGVFHLRDPRTKVYNFDPYLEDIVPISKIDLDAIQGFVPPSKDTVLDTLARTRKKKYLGSTSSLTGVLAHFHFLLSNMRPPNMSALSRDTHDAGSMNYSTALTAPHSIYLHWKDGAYAIDADKYFDTETILSVLGHSLEKMLTLPQDQFEQYLKENSHTIPAEDRMKSGTYHYLDACNFLMRSQLDCQDPRLPGTSTFDIKTRAVVAVRHDVSKAEEYGSWYQITQSRGMYNSFEREYRDMIRSAFLKYSLQVRIGRMDGIFVAFHNTRRIFGFQYIPLAEMDEAIHGSAENDIGEREFRLSIKLLNDSLEKATEAYPEQSLRVTFDTHKPEGRKLPTMKMWVQPVTEEHIAKAQEGRAKGIAECVKAAAGLSEVADEVGQEVSNTIEPESVLDATEDDISEVSLSTAKQTPELNNDNEYETIRELKGYNIMAQSHVDGRRCYGPPLLRPGSRWEVVYSFKDLDDETARRGLQRAFRDQSLVGKVENSTREQQSVPQFIQQLRRISELGKADVEKENETTEDRVVFSPITSISS